MKSQFKISIDFTENEIVATTLYENLKKFNESIIGPYKTKPFFIYVTNDKNEIIGGIKGDFFGELCRVYTVWIHENNRQKGLGTELFKNIDVIAKKNKCKIIQLDTAEFQAKEFYEKLGFSVVATLPSNFMGYTSYILRKILV